MLAVAGAMVLLAFVGVTNAGNLVVLDRLHPFPLLIVAAAFVTSSVYFIVTSASAAERPLSTLARGVLVAAHVALVVMVAIMTPLLAIAFLWLLPSRGSSTVSAPRGHAYEAVVEEGTAMIDPLWTISIHQTSGPLARTWEVGCLSGDDPANALDSVSWDGPERLIIQTAERGRVVVDVSPRTGRPTRTRNPGILGC